jgi:predicted acylesterase/phospholipase RssA
MQSDPAKVNGFRLASAKLALIIGTLALCSCSMLRTPALLQEINRPEGPAGSGTLEMDLATRIARLTKSHMGDSYVDPARVAAWLSAMGQTPDSLTKLVGCLVSPTGFDPEPCYSDFMKAVSSGKWGLPPPPSAIDALKDRTSPQAGEELDAERFIANARGLASSLATLGKLTGRGLLPKVDLDKGIRAGTHLAANYIKTRTWRRRAKRPTTAIVLSGGAANGAFSAGLIWRLMETLESCRSAADGGCGAGAKIDLVVGTSTGTLIGLLIDLYSTPGKQSAARDLLVNSYTCSVASDLYCVNDEWDWALLVGNLKGLVRFDRVRKNIETQIPSEVATNDTEMVAVSVEFETGDIYAQSDQDPEDRGDAAGRVNSILASCVEPVLAEPVESLPRDGTSIRGTYLDGGVRSGLPLLEAVERGAERVLVLSTSCIEPDRMATPGNAMKILMRTIDLLTIQPRIGEVQLGELAAVARRMIEYNVCSERLGSLPPKSKPEVTEFCERRSGFFPAPEGVKAAAVGWIGPAHFRQVASSWRTVWVFRPDEEVQIAGGYEINPMVMRKLFELGAVTFQNRCHEILDLFMVGGTVARKACELSSDEVVELAKKIYLLPSQCTTGKPRVRKCD